MTAARTREQYLRDLEFLAEVTGDTLSTRHTGQLMWRVVNLLHSRFAYDFATMGLIEGDHVVLRAGVGGDQDFHEPTSAPPWCTPLGEGIVGKVAQGGEVRLANDVKEDPDYVEGFVGARSELCVPVVYREGPIGVLDVQSGEANAFDETDVRLLQVVGALVGPAIHTARLYERERQRVRHLHLASELSRLVMSSLDRDQVVSLSCQAMLDNLDISFVAIVLLDRSRTRVVQGGYATRCPFVEGLDFKHWSARLGEGVCSEVIRSGENVRLGDVQTHAAYREVVEGITSHLSVPLRLMGETIGAVVTEHTEPDAFDDDDEALLENIAGYLAQAIDNARLFDSQRRRWQQLLLINEVARIATRTIELEEIIRMVAREVHDRFRYFAVAVMLCEQDQIVVRAVAADGELDRGVGYRERIGEGIAGVVAQTGRTVLADDPEQLGDSLPLLNGIQSVLCVPLASADRVIGAIQVQSLDARAFSDDDRLVLETLAKSVAGAIANARSLRQTEQLREDLNRMIVHDLRNPVQAVQLTLQEVLARTELTSAMSDSVGEGIKCTEDILDMINSLLDVARFEAGRARLRLAPAVLNDHIRAAVRRFAPLARSRGIQVTTVLSQDVPAMRFDHELVNRMIGNLIGNALKFTPDGATVTIRSELLDAGRRTDLPGRCALVAVRDTGEGIPAEYHKKIFDKFGQVESRKAGLKMSTGLGLALCQYVVFAHGGRIWVESEPGQGSTFYIALPVPAKKNER